MKATAEIKIRYFIIDPKDIVYLKSVLEAYEGMVVLRTVDVKKSLIELLIAHDFQNTIDLVVEELKTQVRLQELAAPDVWAPDGL